MVMKARIRMRCLFTILTVSCYRFSCVIITTGSAWFWLTFFALQYSFVLPCELNGRSWHTAASTLTPWVQCEFRDLLSIVNISWQQPLQENFHRQKSTLTITVPYITAPVQKSAVWLTNLPVEYGVFRIKKNAEHVLYAWAFELFLPKSGKYRAESMQIDCISNVSY